MPEPSTHASPLRSRLAIWPWVFSLAAVEGLAAALYLASLPADPGGRFLGFSANRLMLIGLLLGGALLFALLAWRFWRKRGIALPGRPEHWRGWMNAMLVLLPLVALACVLVPLTLMSMYRTGGDFRYLAYAQRMQPLFTWLLLASLEIFGGLAWSGAFQWKGLRDPHLGTRRVFRAWLIVWALAGAVWLFVALTGIGIVPDRVGWGLPTVSLMEWQIWLAWAAGIALMLLLVARSHAERGDALPRRGASLNWVPTRSVGTRDTHRLLTHHFPLDLLLAAAIWLLAAGLWLSQPIRPAFFATAGRAPNYEIYPFSDGAYYDHFAQSVLIGNGFKGGEIPARPMYVTLLAGFHLLAGQKYGNVIIVQTLLLAFFPVILYFLGKALHSRPLGLTVALLAILRELTAIVATPFTDNASNSKLFFADLPAAMAVSLWALLVVLWLKGAGRRPLLPLLVGGGLGLAMLFRTQSMFMLPGVLLLALFVYRFAWRRWLGAAALVVLGVLITLVPWLWRNWSVTGMLAFDDDKSQTGSMAQRYSLSGNDEAYVYRPGENPRDYSERVTQGIFSFLRAHPDVVAGFVSGHLINAEIANVLVLPVRSGIIKLGELIMPARATWQDWNGSLSPWPAVLLGVNLGLIALGVGACWARMGWTGLVLLLLNLSYNFSNALARNSGGRYLLVVDWVMYIYAAVGLMEIAIAVLTVLGVKPERISLMLAQKGDLLIPPGDTIPGPGRPGPEKRAVRAYQGTAVRTRSAKPLSDPGRTLQEEPSAEPLLEGGTRRGRMGQRPVVWWAGLGIGLLFFAVGSLPAWIERAIPHRYPEQTRDALVTEALQAASLEGKAADRAALENFFAQPGAMAVKGRALYPRYYAAGEGEPLTAKTGYEPLDYPRTVFLVTANTYNGLAILKAQEVPTFFPNAADVIVIGCPGGNYLDARMVLLLGEKGAVYIADGGFSSQCPAEGEPAQ